MYIALIFCFSYVMLSSNYVIKNFLVLLLRWFDQHIYTTLVHEFGSSTDKNINISIVIHFIENITIIGLKYCNKNI